MRGEAWEFRDKRFSSSLDEKKAATGTGFSHEVMAQTTVVAVEKKKPTEVATVVQDRDSTVVLDRVYEGNNDLPVRVSDCLLMSFQCLSHSNLNPSLPAIPRFLRHISRTVHSVSPCPSVVSFAFDQLIPRNPQVNVILLN